MMKLTPILIIIWTSILSSFAYSTDVRIREDETKNEEFPNYKRQQDFTVSTTSFGTTKVIVQIKNNAFFVLDDTMKKTVEVRMDNATIMALEVKDTNMIYPWYNNSDVLSIEPDYPVELFENNYNSNNDGTTRKLKESIPYGVDMVLQNKRSKFKKMKAKGSVKVCVCDTGYDLKHNDLPNSPDVIGKDGLGEKWNYDGHSHGTHVAGTIASLSNSKGVYGVIPNNYDGKFKLLITKAFDKSGTGNNSDVLNAIKECAKMGADIISMSLGCNGEYICRSPAMEDYLNSLYKKNVLILAAAGNEGDSTRSYPASYDSVISVASVGYTKARSPFSQHNDQIELSAPGSAVLSTAPGNTYQYKSGTSMATPHVAGVAALLYMAFPECSNVQIRRAKDLDQKGCDKNTGFGLVRANKAFKFLEEYKCGALEGKPDGGCYKIKLNKKKKKKKKKG